MATFFALVFVFTVIALGMNALAETVRGKVTPERPEKPPAKTPADIAVFIRAMSNEGYFGQRKLDDREITYLDDPVLSAMALKLAERYELEWTLPNYRLRLRKTPEAAPAAFRASYEWVIMTPTHAVGFNHPVTPTS